MLNTRTQAFKPINFVTRDISGHTALMARQTNRQQMLIKPARYQKTDMPIHTHALRFVNRRRIPIIERIKCARVDHLHPRHPVNTQRQRLRRSLQDRCKGRLRNTALSIRTCKAHAVPDCEFQITVVQRNLRLELHHTATHSLFAQRPIQRRNIRIAMRQSNALSTPMIKMRLS